MDYNTNLELNTSGTWRGVITGILYLGQKDYSIVAVDVNLSDNKKENIICVGTMSGPQKHASITLKGEVVFDTKYNRKQINVTDADISINTSMKAAINYLSTAVNGIGEATARKIVDKFGVNPADYMLDEKKVMQIPGITVDKYLKIKQSYLDTNYLYPIFNAVQGEITLKQANKIYEQYKDEAVKKLVSNPYMLIYDIDGFGFMKVDKLALKTGVKADSDKRILAAIDYCLKMNEAKSGSSYMPLSDIYTQIDELIFNKEQFMHVYYQYVTGSTVIPDDLSEWKNLLLYDIVNSHYVKLNNAIKKWDVDAARNKFLKEFDLSQDEIDTIDLFYEKKSSLKKQIDTLVLENSYDSRKKTIQKVTNDLAGYDVRNKYKFVLEDKGINQLVLYTFNTYKAECEVAEKMIAISNSTPVFNFKDEYIDKIIAQTEKAELKLLKIEDAKRPVALRKCPTKYSFAEDQKKAIKMSLKNKISCITGGPGRGKTTILKTVIKAWKLIDKESDVILLAPTGKAAKRMSEATGIKAYTIHRFLLNKKIVLTSKTLILADETSMTDLYLMNRLLYKAANCQIVFVGDKDQLPSVGVGKVLEDMIMSKTIPVTFLTTCYRNKGSIFANIESVNQGCRLQELVSDEHFKMKWLNTTPQIIDAIINTYMQNYERYGTENMLVLAAMNKTVITLNNKIQQRINPKTPNKTDINNGVYNLRLGDRVMQTSNDYDIIVKLGEENSTGVFNGETGTITRLNAAEVEVTFDDGKVAVYKDKYEWNNLTLAYAMTYHKSQGSEAKFLICTLTTADFVLLQKKILYTGISRAKEQTYLIGMAKAFQMAIYNYSGNNGIRFSGLQEKLKQFADIKVIC
jgi:exodeoxyribonuclease V alpha subunit